MAPATPHSILSQLAACNETVIYVVGSSFVLGSLVTVFVLLLLDFIRRKNESDAS